MEESNIENLSIYWQGGEVLTLPPEWLLHAHDLIRGTAATRKKQTFNYLQSNLISYGKKWNRVISEMFGNSVGTSMDYPNLYRRLRRGGPEEYDRIWRRKVREAKDAGIEIGVIAIPNEQTVKFGAERFHAHFANELAITDLQINTPFPGGDSNSVKTGFPLENDQLGRFFADLATIWIQQDTQENPRIEPFNKLMDCFTNGNKDLVCIWRENCANEFICVDPRGHVAQCDCWVASYPEFRFGNIFENGSLTEMLEKSEARQNLLARPGWLVGHEDCLECEYLGFCHGGCPVRAYTVYGGIRKKDPYCGLYKQLFRVIDTNLQRRISKTIEDGLRSKS